MTREQTIAIMSAILLASSDETIAPYYNGEEAQTAVDMATDLYELAMRRMDSVPKCAQNGAGEGNRTLDQQLGNG